MAITRFEEILGWQKARELVREVYVLSREARLSRDFALRDQLCRAAVSVMANIAEGFGRKSDRDFAHFLDMARGSACEVQSLLYVALDLECLSQPEFEKAYNLADDGIALIAKFSKYLRQE